MIETQKVWIKDEVDITLVIREGFYGFEKGASFLEVDQIF